MTHRLISIDQVANRLDASVESVRGFVSKGWLAPEVPGEPSYFDASKVERFKKKLPKLQKKMWRNWLALGVAIGVVAALWFRRRPAQGDESSAQ
jgi:hypothetical protein